MSTTNKKNKWSDITDLVVFNVHIVSSELLTAKPFSHVYITE